MARTYGQEEVEAAISPKLQVMDKLIEGYLTTGLVTATHRWDKVFSNITGIHFIFVVVYRLHEDGERHVFVIDHKGNDITKGLGTFTTQQIIDDPFMCVAYPDIKLEGKGNRGLGSHKLLHKILTILMRKARPCAWHTPSDSSVKRYTAILSNLHLPLVTSTLHGVKEGEGIKGRLIEFSKNGVTFFDMREVYLKNHGLLYLVTHILLRNFKHSQLGHGTIDDKEVNNVTSIIIDMGGYNFSRIAKANPRLLGAECSYVHPQEGTQLGISDMKLGIKGSYGIHGTQRPHNCKGVTKIYKPIGDHTYLHYSIRQTPNELKDHKWYIGLIFRKDYKALSDFGEVNQTYLKKLSPEILASFCKFTGVTNDISHNSSFKTKRKIKLGQ